MFIIAAAETLSFSSFAPENSKSKPPARTKALG
jgi:hypothetical protein